MTITYTIDHISASAADVSVPQLVQANLSPGVASFDASQGLSRSVYTLISGDDPSNKMTLTFEAQVDPRSKGVPARRGSIKLRTSVRAANSVSGLETTRVLNLSLSWDFPSDQIVEAADLRQAIDNLYGCSFTTLTSKVPDAELVRKLNFGFTNVLG